jgi:hypothetical protein
MIVSRVVGCKENIKNMAFDIPRGKVGKKELDKLAKGLADGHWRRLMDDGMAKSKEEMWTPYIHGIPCQLDFQDQAQVIFSYYYSSKTIKFYEFF